MQVIALVKCELIVVQSSREHAINRILPFSCLGCYGTVMSTLLSNMKCVRLVSHDT
jgi:hypothetical protein